MREGARTQAGLLLLQQTGLVSCHVAQLGGASAPNGHTEPRHQRERLPGGGRRGVGDAGALPLPLLLRAAPQGWRLPVGQSQARRSFSLPAKAGCFCPGAEVSHTADRRMQTMVVAVEWGVKCAGGTGQPLTWAGPG